jgi:hypothetical protein
MAIVSFPSANTAISKTPLATPTGFGLTVDSSSAITLNWTDVATDGTVEIWRSLEEENNYELIDSVAVGTETYGDSGLTAHTPYYYKLRAFDVSAGYSEFTDWETATTSA